MPTIDNSAADSTVGTFSDNFQGNGLFAQTFTVPNDPAYGALTALTFYYDHLAGGTLDFTVIIAKTAVGPNGGFAVGDRIFDTGLLFLSPDNDDQLAAFNVALGNLQLVAGQQYVFILNAGPRRADGGGYAIGSNTAYAGGQFLEKGGEPYDGEFVGPNSFQDLRFVLHFDAANSLPVANDDTNTVTESGTTSGSLFAGTDTDAEGDPFTITHINGSSAAVGKVIQLPSGAILTTTPYGTYSYNPNGAFDYLVSPSTGAANSTASDTFTYAVTGGDTATVTITIIGENDASNRLIGSAGDDAIIGTAGPDVFDLRQGGDDSVGGLGGRDVFYFGAAFTSADTVDGGGNSDIVILQGDYSTGVTLTGVTNLGNLGSISLFSHTFDVYGGADGIPNSYSIATVEGNVTAGEVLKINGSGLAVAENLTFDGSAETDGAFQIYGGRGLDTLTGGANGDNFIFGHDGRFAAGDTVTGGAGYDVVYLRGDYTIDFNAIGFAGSLVGIESVGLLSFTDTTKTSGGDGEFDYAITWNDSMLGAGHTIVFNGSRLTAEETMSFNGSAETDGKFRLFGGGGNDILTGGDGADLIVGGGRGDTLSGGGGNDIFRYSSVTDSNSTERDGIQDFNVGDLIDLQRIDADILTAGDQAFSFIGDAAFSNKAGELRYENISLGGPIWLVQGDVDGDGVSDFEVLLVISSPDPITASDFLL